jgi:hypothetical protein
MSTTPRPATPEQVRLLIGLSSLVAIPMAVVVMLYVTSQQSAADRAPAWLAFAFALAVGAIMGLVLIGFVPFFGGLVPALAPVRAAVAFAPIVVLVVAIVVGRLVHQAVPVTIGFIAGIDLLLAVVLLIRSLRTR